MNGDRMLGEKGGGGGGVGGCKGYLDGRASLRRSDRCRWLSMILRFDLLVSFPFLLFFGWTWFFRVCVAFGMALALAVLFVLYGGIW